ncbi:MAG TPA: PaaI family thioesterase [Chloroflexota bacterium]
MREPALQDLIPGNHCWGCGPLNEHGLRIKSYWLGEGTTCTWQPSPYHMAGPTHVLNGGIIATIIDCHSVCTAIAGHYRAEGRTVDSEPGIWCVTAALEVSYRRPTPISGPVTLHARIEEVKGRKSIVTCSLVAGGEERATARLVAVRVPPEWRDAEGGQH